MGNYFSLEGAYFQIGTSDLEYQTDLKAAVDIVRLYITSGGHQTEVEEALDYLEAEFPKCRSITQKLRNYIFIDDLFGFDEKYRICAVLYNQLTKRLG